MGKEEAEQEDTLENWSYWPPLISRSLWAPAPTTVSLLEEGFLRLYLQAQQPRHCWVIEISPVSSSWQLQGVLQEVVQRHLACRTSFRTPACSSSFQAFYEQRAVRVQNRISDIQELMQQSISPVGDPPVKLGIQLLESKLNVLLVAHPVLLDAWSMKTLLHEFWALLRQSLQGGSPQLPAIQLDRADFAYWHRGAASSGLFDPAVKRRVDRLLQFSRELARGETDMARQHDQRSGHLKERLQIDADAMRLLKDVSTSWQVTQLELFLAIFAMLLRGWRQRLVIGIEHSCRPGMEILGCCTNVILACLDLPETSLLEAAQLVHAELQSARRDGAAPMAAVQEALRGQAQGTKILYDIFYDMQPRLQLPEKVLGVRAALLPDMAVPPLPRSSADLEIHVVTGGDAEVTILYHPEAISEGSVKTLMRSLNGIVQCGLDHSVGGMASCPTGPLPTAQNPSETVNANSPLDDVRAAVSMALPDSPGFTNDAPLDSLGLDSVSAVFLQGRLSELFGIVLPAWLILGTSTAHLSFAVRRGPVHPADDKVARASARSFRARVAADSDHQAVALIWSRHHHLLEMVPQTTWLLLTGPPAWVAAIALGVGLFRPNNGIELRAAAGYAILAVLQHFVHWLLARCVLSWDLSFGELAPKGWMTKTKPSAIILVETTDSSDTAPGGSAAHTLGVVCARVYTKVERVRRRRRTIQVASLWHAAVLPAARNQGAAKVLIEFAESWAQEVGAGRLEAACLNPAAKAACWNTGLDLWNPRTACWPLAPAFFYKEFKTSRAAKNQNSGCG